MGVSFERLARRGTTLPAIELNPGLMLRIAMVSVGFVVTLYVYIRFIYRLF
jgi:hypothetical protein